MKTVWLKYECTLTHTQCMCGTKRLVLFSIPKLAAVLHKCTSSGALLAWKLAVTEHLIWKYNGIVQEKIMLINTPQSNSGNGGFISWILNRCSHHWQLVRSDIHSSVYKHSLVPRLLPVQKNGESLGTRLYAHTYTWCIYHRDTSMWLPFPPPYNLSILPFPLLSLNNSSGSTSA